MNDQVGRFILLEKPPKRVVCLVPSLTELLVDLGLKNALVGVTKFCVHPENLRKEKTIVGGTKTVHLDRIAALKPDFILCNKEENTSEIVASCEQLATVYVSEIITFEDFYKLLSDLGNIFDIQNEVELLTIKIQNLLLAFRQKAAKFDKYKVAYVIWKNPFMVAGVDTFINSILELFPFENIFKEESGRYPEIQEVDLKDTDLVLLSSEPFPFSEKHRLEFEKITSAKILLVNGEYFSWYGSRLLKAFEYFDELLRSVE